MLVVFLPAFHEQFSQFCFRVARVQSSCINVAFPIKPQGSGSYSTRPSQRERGWYLKRFSSAKSPSLLSDCSGIWCLPFSDQLSGVFASHTRVKNVINSAALYRGRHLAQKCVLMGYVSVFWVLASYLWPLSSLILPFSNYLSPLFLRPPSFLPPTAAPWMMVHRWSSEQERLRWLPCWSHSSLNEPYSIPDHILYMDRFNEFWGRSGGALWK